MTNSPATPTDPQTPPTSDASVASAKPTGLKASQRTALLGAMFLMATSAIGPGFITQTSEFTVKLGAAFAFAIVVSILVDIAVQLNVWRVIGVSGRRAQDLGSAVIPGVGWVLAGLVFIGGLVFSQVLTLYTTPVVYLYLDRARHRFNKWRGVRTDAALDTAL